MLQTPDLHLFAIPKIDVSGIARSIIDSFASWFQNRRFEAGLINLIAERFRRCYDYNMPVDILDAHKRADRSVQYLFEQLIRMDLTQIGLSRSEDLLIRSAMSAKPVFNRFSLENQRGRIVSLMKNPEALVLRCTYETKTELGCAKLEADVELLSNHYPFGPQVLGIMLTVGGKVYDLAISFDLEMKSLRDASVLGYSTTDLFRLYDPTRFTYRWGRNTVAVWDTDIVRGTDDIICITKNRNGSFLVRRYKGWNIIPVRAERFFIHLSGDDQLISRRDIENWNRYSKLFEIGRVPLKIHRI